jgi:hypothetical protein
VNVPLQQFEAIGGGALPPAIAARIRRDTKLGRILTVLASGRSLNRFEAERLGDHCLHSTVSSIERRFGVQIDRAEETVPGWEGHTTRVMRYHLAPDQRQMAVRLLGLIETD